MIDPIGRRRRSTWRARRRRPAVERLGARMMMAADGFRLVSEGPIVAAVGVVESITPAHLSILYSAPADASADGDRAVIGWGDGTTSAGSITFNGTVPGEYDIRASHAYAEAGTFSVTALVADSSGHAATATATATVVGGPIGGFGLASASIAGIPLGEPDLLRADTPVVLATFQDAAGTDPSGIAGAIDWGDGSAPTGASIAESRPIDLAIPAPTGPPQGGYSASGDHTYAAPGTYPIRVTILDRATGASAVLTASATIAPFEVDPSPLPAFDLVLGRHQTPLELATGEAATTIGYLRAPADAAASDFVAAVDWGDGSAPEGLAVDPDASLRGTVSGSLDALDSVHRYAEPGSYSAKVTVLDPRTGRSAVGVTPVVVSAERIDAVAGPTPIAGVAGRSIGDPILGTFQDVDQSATHAASIDWGDGSAPTAGTIDERYAEGFTAEPYFAVSGDHAYAGPGSYTVRVSIVGSDGAAASVEAVATIAPASSGVATPPLSSTPAGPISARAGVGSTFRLGAVSTLDAAVRAPALRAVVDYGDGTPAAPARVVRASAGRFRVVGQHRFGAAGLFEASVTVAGPAGASTRFVVPITATRPPARRPRAGTSSPPG